MRRTPYASWVGDPALASRAFNVDAVGASPDGWLISSRTDDWTIGTVYAAGRWQHLEGGSVVSSTELDCSFVRVNDSGVGFTGALTVNTDLSIVGTGTPAVCR